MLLEALEWLARETIVDKSLSRLARQADQFSPGLGPVVYRIAGGAQAGRGCTLVCDRGVEGRP